MNTAGVGFNGVVSDVVSQIKYLRGRPMYIWGVIKSAISYKSIPLKITLNGTVIEDDIFMVSICNGKSEGGGFIVAPDAILDDGFFDVTIVRDAKLMKLLLNINNAMKGELNKLDEVETIRGDSIVIESEQPMPIHADGEVIEPATTKVSAKLLKGVLKVLSN